VEELCTKLADDSLSAVQDMNAKLDQMEANFSKKITQVETSLSDKLSDSIEQITTVLRRLIEFQKAISTRPTTTARKPVITRNSVH
jgi:paraquat-inducible protein B